MDDPNATVGVVIPIVIAPLYSALGQVEIVSLWSQVRLQAHLWRAVKPLRGHGWKTTQLPDQHSGRF